MRGPPPPRSSSPDFSQRGRPPPRSSSPTFSQRGPLPRSASPAFSSRGDRMNPRYPGPPPAHQRKRSNSMEILNFAQDFEIPRAPGLHEDFGNDRSRSPSMTGNGGSRMPTMPGMRRPESPGPGPGLRPGSRADSRSGSPFRAPPGYIPPRGAMGGPGSRPASRTGSRAGSRRNSGESRPGGLRGSLSDDQMDHALGLDSIRGQERRYRPPPQMRGGKMGGPPSGSPMLSREFDDPYSMMDSGRMPAPRREEMT